MNNAQIEKEVYFSFYLCILFCSFKLFRDFLFVVNPGCCIVGNGKAYRRI